MGCHQGASRRRLAAISAQSDLIHVAGVILVSSTWQECLVETARGWVTPARGPKRYQHDYDALNAVGAALCAEFGFSFVDITSMLRRDDAV